MLTYNMIYLNYLHHAGKVLNIKVTFIRDGRHIREIHIQDFIFYSFKEALHCLMSQAPFVMTDVTDAELVQMNQKEIPV